jgi:alginate O-acetyltransferase complex protein AlgI
LQLGQLDLILPMGISFYTFQSMSYTIDVYRGTLAPLRSFWRFLLFVSFFPQLVAGPIVRAKDFLYQLDRNRRLHLGVALEGCWLVIRGLFLKTVVADNLGPVVDHWWQASAEPGANASIARAVILLFSFQIFCDFAGYSSIARGLAYLLGFRLPTNFEAPYIAGTFRNFWTRWHISLSSWFRDYLYIPLGGSRYGWKRTAIAILLTFVISGLWHGPARTFLLWGLLHGLALLLERAVGMSGRIERPAWLRLSWFFFVQLLVLAAWTFFRADSVPQALGILSNASSLRVDSLASFPWLACGALLLGPVAVHLRTLLCERGLTPAMGRIERALLAAVMLYAAATAHGVNNAFIYFQF